MAEAKVETVTKTVEKEVSEDVYTLKLNREEAQTLYTLLSNVGGNTGTTYNKYVYSIWDAIGSLGGIRFVTFRSRFSLDYNRIAAKPLDS